MKQIGLIIFFITISSFLFAQNGSGIRDQIIGDWYFIDKEADSLLFYHEAYIDSASIQYLLGYHGFISFEYLIANDTIYYFRDHNDKDKGFLLISTTGDTLTIKQFEIENNRSRIIDFVRLPENAKTPKDYDWSERDAQMRYAKIFRKRSEKFTARQEE